MQAVIHRWITEAINNFLSIAFQVHDISGNHRENIVIDKALDVPSDHRVNDYFPHRLQTGYGACTCDDGLHRRLDTDLSEMIRCEVISINYIQSCFFQWQYFLNPS